MKEILTKQEATRLSKRKGEYSMSSLKIADTLNKRHSDVLRDIRTMLAELDKTEGTFSMKYKSGTSSYPFMLLPKREFTILITGYSIKARAMLVDEWDEMKSVKTDNDYVRYPQISEGADFAPTLSTPSSDKFKAIMMAQKNMEKSLEQQDRLLTMIESMDEPTPIDTVIVNDDTKLSDLVGKGKTKTTLKMIGL